MAIPREQFQDILKDSFSAYYTIVENIDTDLPLAFRADYRLRDERYWLTKSVKIWGNEKNEYCYIFAADAFTPELAQKCMDWAIKDGIPRVKPHSEHQCTNIKVVLIADDGRPEEELYEELPLRAPRLFEPACRADRSRDGTDRHQPRGARAGPLFQEAICRQGKGLTACSDKTIFFIKE